MRTKSELLAKRIVKKVLSDLEDRQGIGDALGDIDDDVSDEMKLTLVEIVKKELDAGQE